MKLPSITGRGKLPRYGGGWMPQFGHTYLLQQEILEKPVRDPSGLGGGGGDWFRSLEMWHTGRQEGLAMNVAHYTNILRHCACDAGAPWSAALDVLRQMRRDAVRADINVVTLALHCCARESRWLESLSVFSFFANMTPQSRKEECKDAVLVATGARNQVGKHAGVGLMLDSVCVASVLQSCVAADRQDKALQFVNSLTCIDEKSSTGVSCLANCRSSLETALNDLAVAHDVPTGTATAALLAVSSKASSTAAYDRVAALPAEPKSSASQSSSALQQDEQREPEMVTVQARTREWTKFFQRLFL